ncbi:MAG: NYN domain-containing protein [Acidobacteria bacterium]|nr:NYN domain-containing protein [Acidobacteriota bacterium]
MNVTTDTRSTRIAVFIDFDNVEIGVKNTIGGQFDIGLVLDAIKERGEIVTKIAYSDWKRVGDYSRLLTQHAIRMVQRNMTPGGDKNGADITMALDALEMCFTHDHINAFVIVGGDSDFISLVEKLKQYGRKVIVVGGRQFTSATMQQNCHEFIAYENLVGSRGGRVVGRGARPSAGTSSSPVTKALPLIMRALKVLSDREVTPQLGLLKSTLLQLDSTFSEREYGAGSFRDFMEKVAAAGAVTLREAGRSMLVEARQDGPGAMPATSSAAADSETPSAVRVPVSVDSDSDEDALPVSPMTMQDGIRAVQRAFGGAATPPRWPMYARQAKQFLRNAVAGFDERHYGFASVVDLLRAAGKEGVLRVERDRQGAVRVFAGPKLTALSLAPAVEDGIVEAGVAQGEPAAAEPVLDAPIVDADIVGDAGAMSAAGSEGARKSVRRRRAVKPKSAGGATKAAKPARPRARKGVRAKAVAADVRE